MSAVMQPGGGASSHLQSQLGNASNRGAGSAAGDELTVEGNFTAAITMGLVRDADVGQPMKLPGILNEHNVGAFGIKGSDKNLLGMSPSGAAHDTAFGTAEAPSPFPTTEAASHDLVNHAGPVKEASHSQSLSPSAGMAADMDRNREAGRGG